ncbi:unnamed protein product [Sphenostylis stenocarpa]|uniref:Epidermal patterning factor-like protein n=1 Tax=Sphenostylis stenocarpa TaxID=92480 RepID=A0AA86SLB7_9FABA|nr:unnamed protein product [Sphenostylis stenocarpa]
MVKSECPMSVTENLEEEEEEEGKPTTNGYVYGEKEYNDSTEDTLVTASMNVTKWSTLAVEHGPEEAPGPESSPLHTVESDKVCHPSPILEFPSGIPGVYFPFLKGVMSDTMEEVYNRGVSKIGSSPPNCEHKCYGCTPCEAIQVPSTTSRRSHLSVQYANYEPESWKCKCGPSLYSP